MYPMLLSVGPILGQGHLIGFTGSKGFRYYVSYRSNTLSGGPYFVDPSALPGIGCGVPRTPARGPGH